MAGKKPPPVSGLGPAGPSGGVFDQPTFDPNDPYARKDTAVTLGTIEVPASATPHNRDQQERRFLRWRKREMAELTGIRYAGLAAD